MNKVPPLKAAILLSVVVLLVGSGITYWANGASQSTKDRYLKLEGEVPDESELQAQLQESQATVDSTKTQLQHLEQAVPSLAYVPTLLTELELLGKHNNITVTGVRPVLNEKQQKDTAEKKSGQKKAGYEEMLIDISGRGSYADVMAMVNALKTFPKIVAIQTVGLQPRRESALEQERPDPNRVVLDATVRIKAYLFPVPQAGKGTSQAEGASS